MRQSGPIVFAKLYYVLAFPWLSSYQLPEEAIRDVSGRYKGKIRWEECQCLRFSVNVPLRRGIFTE